MSAAVRAIKAAYRPDGLNVGANLGRVGRRRRSPGHFHVHVLPRWNGDTNFMTTVADARVLPETLSSPRPSCGPPGRRTDRSAWAGRPGVTGQTIDG